MRFSTESLSKAKQNFIETINTTQENFFIIAIVALTGIVVVFMGLMYISVTRLIKNPLKQLIEAFRDLSEGDLKTRLTINKPLESTYRDEIEEVSISFNSFIILYIKLQDIITQITIHAGQLCQSSGNLSGYSKEMYGNMENLTIANSKASTATNQFSYNINSMAASTDEMSLNISHIADSAENIANHMNKITHSAENMNESFNSIATNIHEGQKISTEAMALSSEATQKIKILETAAREIDKVTGIIKRISFQTNILALNAAIEASSAGDAGWGFSVVFSCG